MAEEVPVDEAVVVAVAVLDEDELADAELGDECVAVAVEEDVAATSKEEDRLKSIKANETKYLPAVTQGSRLTGCARGRRGRRG